MASASDNELLSNYLERKESCKKEKEKKKVGNLLVGDKIDFLGENYIWEKALVKQMIYQGRSTPAKLIIILEVNLSGSFISREIRNHSRLRQNSGISVLHLQGGPS